MMVMVMMMMVMVMIMMMMMVMMMIMMQGMKSKGKEKVKWRRIMTVLMTMEIKVIDFVHQLRLPYLESEWRCCCVAICFFSSHRSCSCLETVCSSEA